MVLLISLMSLEELGVANVVFWVAHIYDGVTWKYDEVSQKGRATGMSFHKGMLLPCIGLNF